MNTGTNITTSELVKRLKAIENKQFTGVIKIRSKSGKSWNIYLCLSRIIWADGGPHINRSWRRLWLKYFPKVESNKITFSEAQTYECWNYQILTLLIKKNIIKKEEVALLIEEKVLEVLFDIRQTEVFEEVKYAIKEANSADYLWEVGLNVSINMITIDSIINNLQQSWEKWVKLNLTPYSPNYAPLIVEADKLKENISPVIYQNFTRILNGKFALRTLSQKMNQDIVKLTTSLSSYIRQGWIKLVEIPDLADELTPFKTTSLKKHKSPQSEIKPLIACIDDSPQVTQIMEKIVTDLGYRFVAIKDALQVVPTLIENVPDLIFLDLVMPIVNGYEVCAQIKRVSKLEHIPVIILTGNDGVVDRVRSKMVGSSEFMPKPIVEKDVVSKIEKLLAQRKNKTEKNEANSNSNPQKTQLFPI